MTRRFAGLFHSAASLAVAVGIVPAALLIASCSKEMKTYDELSAEGGIESLARRNYRDFFRAAGDIGKLDAEAFDAESDSALFGKVFELTDRLIADVRMFPGTVQSRIALDALTYAAADLLESPAIGRPDVSNYWRIGLLDPVFTEGQEYIKAGKTNDSTILQLITALQRGMGNRADDDMLLEAITIVGPAPSRTVLERCNEDSLVFKRVHDLIIYSRSLQEMGPPIWMMTGPWLMAVAIEGWPLQFYCLKPLIFENDYYLTFRDYTQGEVYAAAYDDPIPDDSALMDGWLARASAWLDSLAFTDEFAAHIRYCGLPTWDAHNFYNDLMLQATADSAKSEYRIIFKREKVEGGAFQFAGVDSTEIVLTEREIMSRADTVTPLMANHYLGESIIDGQFVGVRRGEGMAYVMPMGEHDDAIVREFQQKRRPKIDMKVN
ncbi:MAG: hypothetical protein J7M24_07195 [Candidatus Latescibacteria bacterium]|nr:hypothetical protein [Candidatus Latescibacterota bacterium]